MRLADMRFPELKERELEILKRRHEELNKQGERTVVEDLEMFLTGSIVAKAKANEPPFETALHAWSVIWSVLILRGDGWKNRDYDDTALCFRVAATDVMKLLS